MPERGGVAGTFLTPYQVTIASGQLRTSGAATASTWFGALQPMPQNVPDAVRGRAFDFPAGANLDGRPKSGEGYSFPTLRELADGYDLLRLIIETRKDQVARQRWTIKARDGAARPGDRRIDAITRFLRKPDGVTPMRDWLRALLEDLFVLDAPCAYKRRDNGGNLLALELIDGGTIVRLIDDLGRTPMPLVAAGVVDYPPAYQQILKGGRLDYTARDLLYAPRNARSHRRYGYSPVEQVITTVNIALRRQATTLEYFTDGNMPDALISVPESWSPQQIRDFQGLWDEYYAHNNTALRRKTKFIPGGQTVTQTREPVLKDELDEWLARVVCFAFSVSPQALSKMMNRGTAETAKGSAEEEGLAPTLDWIKGVFDDILDEEFGAGDLEWAWVQDDAVDEEKQAGILQGYVKSAIMTVNESRHKIGLDPYPNPAADKLMVLTATGFVDIDINTVEGKKRLQDAGFGTSPQLTGGGAPQDGGAGAAPAPQQAGSNARQPRTRAVAKAAGAEEAEDPEPFGTADQEGDLLDALAAALVAQGDDTAGQVEAALAPVQDHHTAEHLVEAIAAALAALSFGKVQTLTLVLTLSRALQDAAAIGARVGAEEADLAAASGNDAVKAARAAADRRAAEMVGLRWTGPEGQRRVEPDPAAQRDIVGTLRDRVGVAIDKVAAGEGFAARAAAAVRTLPIWGKAHAEGIAASEVESAANAGAMSAYEAAGPALGKRWVCLEEACAVCQRNAAEGVVPLAHVFGSGHRAPTAHPRCRCRIACEALPLGKAFDESKHRRDASGRFVGGVEKVVEDMTDPAMLPAAGSKARELHDDLVKACAAFGPGTRCQMIYDDGQLATLGMSCGPSTSALRSFADDANGKTVTHDFFQVDEARRGDGSAKAFLRGSVAAYQRAGIDRIRVHANIDVGGYAWLRYGFEPDGDSVPALAYQVEEMANELRKLRLIDNATLQTIQKSAKAGKFYEIAASDVMVELGDGSKESIGKWLLLNSNWHGTLDLRNTVHMARFSRYVGVS